MATFMYAVMSITQVASIHCAERPEISPCTCEPIYSHNYVELSCEKVDSFYTVVEALSGKFEPNVNISLKISYSQLEDLEMRSFKDMKLNVVKLRMQWNGIRSLPELPFRGLSNVEFLGIGYNELDEIPKHMLNHMPLVKTLDMGRCRIRSVLQDDLKGVQMVTYLFLASNNISRLDEGAFPTSLLTLHLGRNQITSLNGTLRHLNKIESLFINMNMITTLDNELPESKTLKLILAQNNSLDHLPESMHYMNRLESVQFQNNRLISLNRTFKHKKNLNLFSAHNNEIQILAVDEFQECSLLEELNLAGNHIISLNNSLLPLASLSIANFSSNEIEEFSMHEIRGLKNLKQLDLSFNRIKKLTGRLESNETQTSSIIELNLNNNLLKSLDGALKGLRQLRILSLSFNEIQRILPEDFAGLVKLELLDLSHNNIKTLMEMETAYLPNLKILKVAYNNLEKLDRDFHGMPVLCQANLTKNKIKTISADLVSHTRCMNHNVPGKLELHLEENPIMCEERLHEICSTMSDQEARIRGRSTCFESDQEVCTALSMLYNNIYPNHRNAVPEFIENPISNGKLKEELPLPPVPWEHNNINKPFSFIVTTTTTTPPPPPPTTTESETEQALITKTLTVAPSIAHVLASLTTLNASVKSYKRADDDQKIVLDIATNDTDHTLNLKVPDTSEILETATVAQTEYATVSYIPNIDEYISPDALPPKVQNVPNNAKLLKEDNLELEDSKSNSIHDEYSTVIFTPDIENAAHSLILPKNPPEAP